MTKSTLRELVEPFGTASEVNRALISKPAVARFAFVYDAAMFRNGLRHQGRDGKDKGARKLKVYEVPAPIVWKPLE
jgi:hypothetical protein